MVGSHVPPPVAHGLVGAGMVAALRRSNEVGGWKWLAFGALVDCATSAEGATYDSQGQALSAAKCVAPGTKNNVQ